LTVENHRYCLPIRGNGILKALERHLETIAFGTTPRYVASTKLIIPTPDFNALFLTSHALNHFLSEGIKLRHICDWAMFLHGEQNNINWEEFYAWGERLHFTRFANALTAISVTYLGLEITNPHIITHSPFAEQILDDTLFSDTSLFNRGYGVWRGRLLQISTRLRAAWKYHKIYQKSVTVEILRLASSFIFERNPKL
jgi:hypothetical protein